MPILLNLKEVISNKDLNMNKSTRKFHKDQRFILEFICNIIILSKHNNFKIMSQTIISLGHNLLPQESVTYSITISTLFPNETDNNEDLEPLHIFQSTTLQEHLNFLKRYHLEIPNVPEIKLLGDFRKNTEITMRVYTSTLLERINRYTHQQKLNYTIQLLKTYRALNKQYGYFFITHNHIKVDERSNLALWINEDYRLNFPSIPLTGHRQDLEHSVVGQLIKIIKQFFTESFFKYRQILSFNQLASYLQFVKKRNKIHKNCGIKARQKNEIKRRNTLSVRNLRMNEASHKEYDRFFRLVGSSSTLIGSKATGWGSRENYPSQSLIKCSSTSRIEISKGSNDSKKMKSEFDTTVVSSELKNTRNMSYLQLSTIIQKSQKKSCIFGSNPQVITDNPIKHSSVMTKKNSTTRLNTHFCPIQYKRQTQKKTEQLELKNQEKKSLGKKNSLQIGQIELSHLLLSQINEDPQNQTGGSDLKRRQYLIDEFETLLLN